MVSSKLWHAALVCGLVVTMTASANAGPRSGGESSSSRSNRSILKDLLGITDLEDDVAALQADVAALQAENGTQQSQINALLIAVASLNVTVSQKCDDIDLLFECKDALDQRLSRIEAVVDCQETVCDVGGKNMCVDTDIDRNHCGACNTACAANEDCVGGSCQLKPCDPIDDCHDATLLMDGTCQQTPKANTTPCDDGTPCTVADICQSGVCVGFGSPCNSGETCSVDGMGSPVCN
jgi:uncharacterized small protein (DUF1192 family)